MTTVSVLAEFKQLLRENDFVGDPWGTAMGAHFEVASHLFEKGECPAAWQYRVGWGGNHVETDSPYYDFLIALDAEDLEEIGNYLARICEALKRAGRDY